MKKVSREELLFYRMSGAQNTFFVANAFHNSWKQFLKSNSQRQIKSLVRKICNDYYGFQTDGVLFLKQNKNYDFEWLFFNSDGSKAEMCGNASRCASAYFYKYIANKKYLRFLTKAGAINSKVLSEKKVSIEMIRITDCKKIKILNRVGFLVNTGVPHFVILEKPNIDLAKRLRKTKKFGKAGANITFAFRAKNRNISAVTFERGVENFTQACGTGAVAVAVVTGKKEIQMPGGRLRVDNAKIGLRPILTGPVRFEFQISKWERK